jgi:hypothetical protein
VGGVLLALGDDPMMTERGADITMQALTHALCTRSFAHKDPILGL